MNGQLVMLQSTTKLSDTSFSSLRSSLSSVSMETGVGMKTLREYGLSLANVGVSGEGTDKVLSDLIRNTVLLSYANTGTNDSTEQLAKSMERLVRTGNLETRSLGPLKLNMQELTEATGKSEEELKKQFKAMDAVGRAEFLNEHLPKIKDFESAAAMAAVSVDGLSDTVRNRLGAILTELGQTMLPYVTVALETFIDVLSSVLSNIENLSPSAREFLGTLATLTAVALPLMGVFTGLGFVVQGLGLFFGPLIGQLKGAGTQILLLRKGVGALTATKMGWIKLILLVIAALTALYFANDDVKGIIDAVIGAIADVITWFQSLSPSMQVLIPILFAVTVAMATFATATSLAGLPIILIIGSIVALVAILWHLYNTNASVKAAIDWVIEGLKWLWEQLQQIPAAIQGAIDSFVNFITNLWNTAVQVATAIGQIIFWFVTLPIRIGFALGQAIASVVQWGIETVSAGINAAVQFITSVVSWFMQLPGRIWTWLVSAIQKIVAWALQTVSKGKQGARDTVTGIINFIKTLPSKIWTWLKQAISKIKTWATDTLREGKQGAKDTVTGIVDWFLKLPTRIWDAIKGIPKMVKDCLKDALKDVPIIGNLVSAVNPNADDLLGNDENYMSDVNYGVYRKSALNNRLKDLKVKELEVGSVKNTSSGSSESGVGGNIENVFNFNSLVTERDVTEFIIEIVEGHMKSERVRSGHVTGLRSTWS